MCGIAGFIELKKQSSNQELEATAAAMADKIIHRGPDDGGVWADEENGIAFAHRRLSIIDLSSEGSQPMTSSCGRFIIVYNGEIYNYQDIANDLSAEGATFKGHSDTEVLLEAVSRWGLVKALEASNGMFAFALWDKKEKQLHLCRDRFGQKPLFYGWSNGVFLFSSELKTFDAHKSFAQSVNSGSLTLYLRHGFVPAPYSVFENIFKLTAGTYLTLSQEALSKPKDFSPEPDGNASTLPKRYWSALDAVNKGNNCPFEGSDKEAVDALEDLLLDAVGKCMVSDVPLGAFLSGGIDSSAIVALMQKQSSRPVKTFSMGFHEKQFNEAHHAAAVAKHLGTDHTEMYVTQKDAREVIPMLPSMYDEPFSDSSQIPTYLVSKMARQHVTVSLSGDGGDEFFGGYNRYLLGRKITRASSMTPSFVKKAATKFMQGVPVGKWDY
ncbi:MAG: asparagine synthase (glutamine-hydrolyzing), partial [Alphaproteobacteria bacterium]|nr:asparagine synthase (glutamine-hydrolyzing) [Alphaproteobacteria bacterium]